MSSPQRIAIITSDVLAQKMAGPSIRASNMARALADDGHDVLLISTSECSLTADGYRCEYASWSRLREAVGDAEVVISQGFVSYHAPWLLRTDKILVFDLYDPMHFEQLEQMADLPQMQRNATIDLTTRVFNEQLVRGDFFLCASEEQRHLWLGQLAAMGRINPANYDRDSSLDDLIAVCPFGLPVEAPQKRGPGIRDVPGIGANDKVLLWAGGVYNWFDPLSLIRAVDVVRREHDDLRLFFLGMKHPNPGVPKMQMAWDARELSESLGLTGQHVFFNEGWVPYDDRANFLLDADAGVSTHLRHVETTFSFRTRLLDYFWAGLPIISTAGDSLGELVERAALGVKVQACDVDGLVEAINRVLYDDAFAAASAAAVARIRDRFVWPVALAPLVEFCRAPRRAADAHSDQRRFARHPVMPTNPILRQALRGTTLLREGGLGLVGSRVVARTKRVASERSRDGR